MKLITLGTGSPIPDPQRAGPSSLVRVAGKDFLFDCGRGVLMRAAAAMSGAAAFHTVFLTHLHSDHITDFNDVVTMRWVMSPTPSPLRVVGPVGTATFVEKTLDMLATDIGYRLAHHADLNWEPAIEVLETSGGVVMELDGVRVTAAPTNHRPVEPTVGYRVDFEESSVVIGGDSVPCEGLDLLCQGADVYLQTVIRESLVKSIPVPRLQDILDYHSSTVDAGTTAQRAGVKKLVMTHLVPAPWPGTESEWIDEAKSVFDGEIILANDLMEIDLTS
jgi:ribonuclease Z